MKRIGRRGDFGPFDELLVEAARLAAAEQRLREFQGRQVGIVAVDTVLKPITIRGTSNFEANSLWTGSLCSIGTSGFRGGNSADGIGPNSSFTRAIA